MPCGGDEAGGERNALACSPLDILARFLDDRHGVAWSRRGVDCPVSRSPRQVSAVRDFEASCVYLHWRSRSCTPLPQLKPCRYRTRGGAADGGSQGHDPTAYGGLQAPHDAGEPALVRGPAWIHVSVVFNRSGAGCIRSGSNSIAAEIRRGASAGKQCCVPPVTAMERAFRGFRHQCALLPDQYRHDHLSSSSFSCSRCVQGIKFLDMSFSSEAEWPDVAFILGTLRHSLRHLSLSGLDCCSCEISAGPFLCQLRELASLELDGCCCSILPCISQLTNLQELLISREHGPDPEFDVPAELSCLTQLTQLELVR